jgi:hypothetical protein
MNLINILKALPEGIANIDKVVEGHVNSVKMKYGDLPQDQQEEIVRRRLICQSCPYNTSNMEGSTTKNVCSMCGCPINAKTACLTCYCGIYSHNHNNPESILTPKWVPYGQDKL